MSLPAPEQSDVDRELSGVSVLYFSSSAHIQGGAVQSMFRLARWLKQQGGNPVVVLPRQGAIMQWYEKEGIDVRIIPFEQMHRRWSAAYLLRYVFSTLAAIARLVTLIRREGIDAVHVNEIVYFPGLIAARIAGVKSICHVRVIVERPSWLRRLLIWLATTFSDEVVCVSDAVRVNMFPSGSSKIRTLYNPGPDLDRFDPKLVDGSLVRGQLGVAPDAFLVGLVSKFSPLKGHLGLVEAARMIADHHPDLRAKYLVVGGTVPGHEDYLVDVKHKVGEYGLQESFIFAGVQENIPGLMAAADVMVHIPLHEDPFPGVVLEAMAMKKPVVAFASGGIGEQFENRQSGILLEKDDVGGLEAALVDLAHDQGLRLALGEAARSCLTSRFSATRFSTELKAIYGSLRGDSGN